MALTYSTSAAFVTAKCIKDGDVVTALNLNSGVAFTWDTLITVDSRLSSLESWRTALGSLGDTLLSRDGSGWFTGPLKLNGNNIYFNGTTTVGDDYINFNDTTNVYSFVSDGSTANTTIVAATFNGTATSAKYADLAEIYSTDKEYEVGTVLEVNSKGETEMTEFNGGALGGVVSEKPGLIINAEAQGQFVALKGKVPVKCKGDIKKGQYCVAVAGGFVEGKSSEAFVSSDMLRLVGIALENSKNGFVEVKI